MRCPMAARVTRLLHGDLSPAATRTTLNHVRDCETCRERMADQGRTAPSGIFSSEGERRYRRYTAREIAEARERTPRRSLRGPLALLMIVLLVGVGLRARSVTPRASGPDDPDRLCARALAEGRPYAGSPRGDLPGRPRVFGVALPPGTDAFEVLVLADGEPLWSRRFSEGDPGVILDAVEGSSPDGPYRATRGFAPFPGPGELALEAGRPYEVRFRLDAGQLSTPLPFRLLPDPPRGPGAGR